MGIVTTRVRQVELGAPVQPLAGESHMEEEEQADLHVPQEI